MRPTFLKKKKKNCSSVFMPWPVIHTLLPWIIANSYSNPCTHTCLNAQKCTTSSGTDLFIPHCAVHTKYTQVIIIYRRSSGTFRSNSNVSRAAPVPMVFHSPPLEKKTHYVFYISNQFSNRYKVLHQLTFIGGLTYCADVLYFSTLAVPEDLCGKV